MPILDDDLHGRRLRGKCHGNDRDVGDHSVIPGDHVGNFDAGLDLEVHLDTKTVAEGQMAKWLLKSKYGRGNSQWP